MKSDLEQFYGLIDEIKIAMMTTRRADGHLESRAMAKVDIHAAVYLEVNEPKPVVLFELAKGWLTGERIELGETHHLIEPHR